MSVNWKKSQLVWSWWLGASHSKFVADLVSISFLWTTPMYIKIPVECIDISGHSSEVPIYCPSGKWHHHFIIKRLYAEKTTSLATRMPNGLDLRFFSMHINLRHNVCNLWNPLQLLWAAIMCPVFVVAIKLLFLFGTFIMRRVMNNPQAFIGSNHDESLYENFTL